MMTTNASTMRLFVPIVLMGGFVPGLAGASSLEVLERLDDAATPSTLYYGPAAGAGPAPDVVFEPSLPLAAPPPELAGAPLDTPVALSPSVIEIGEPAVEKGLVAAIPEAEKQRPRNPHLPPMVIRGGIFGDPATRPAQESPPPQVAAPQASEPGVQPQQARPPEPAPPPPPAPTRRVE